MTLREIAGLVSGHVNPDRESIEIHGPASLVEAGPGDIAFFGNAKYLAALRATQASAVLVPHGCGEEIPAARIWVDNPSAAFAKILAHFAPEPVAHPAGVHPTAVVAGSAQIDSTAHVGAGVVIEAGTRIGARTVIAAQSFIGHHTTVGADCFIHPRVTVRERCKLGDRVHLQSGAVIGSDGFGYELQDGRHVKIPQTGIVQIDDDVEIGANTTIDRARFGRTWIQTGAKIDNLVQIAHNVRVGAHSIICSQAGVSGSTRIGSYVTLAGQVGLVGHIEVGDRAIVAAQTGLSRNLKAGEVVCGSPARPIQDWKEQAAQVNRLGRLYDRVKRLEEKLNHG
ncbi:MAG: UDP-3-O-(3-hydroxymyristoyl)glucosamine N-acyltransferase [Terrimicrobiaceae bacterium]|nr:UDP-3-O-(3-hydroxymyristoyl)glucosamine N-acyltransferase [Terrimicrobiaceae bacterium]